jgi:hypothetical protein
MGLGDTLLALVGIGKPQNTPDQRQLEAHARDN